MSNKLDVFVKMFFDYTLTAVGTVAISPLLFYIAYRINKEDPGPIFFAHTRIGKDGKAFPCYKFRSMVVNGKEMFYKTAIPVWMMGIFYAMEPHVILGGNPFLLGMFYTCILFYCILYTVITSGRVRFPWLLTLLFLLPIAAAPIAFILYFCKDGLLAGGTGNLAAAAGANLDVVNGGTQGYVLEGHSVANLRGNGVAGLYGHTNGKTYRGEDVALGAVFVLHEGDAAGAVRIILDAENLGGVATGAAEVYEAVVLLVTTTDVTGGDTAIVVTTTGFAVFFQQRSKRFALVQLRVNHFNYVATTRRCRFTFNNCHCITPPTYSAPPTKSRFWPSFRVT